MHGSTRGHAGTRRRIAGAVGVLGMLAALTACSGSDEPSDDGSAMSEDGGTTAVTVGVIPIVDVAPIYLGVDQGFFTDQGLDVTLETAQGGAAIVPAVVSGQYQFGFSNSTSLLLATSSDLALQAVTAGVATTGEEGADFGGVVVPADSDIESVADLAGKTVAVNTLNNINTTTINQAVRDAGGDPSTITYTELGFPDIVPAVAQGDVDAGQVVEPFLSAAEAQDMRQIVSNYAAADPDLTISMYFTSDQFAQEDPDTVEQFTAAMNESLEYADAHPDEVREILGTYTDMDAATLDALTLPRWPTEIDTDSIQLLADLAVTDGVLDEAPDLDALLP
ncbi:ABC transporter substrate-binding protein [Isoptericola aurantiacus]|uniref:ABC transporter substrate-binding protein n=1 Tax=Isoptericola aurantiacus TaxID=3377839 RepID=UPI00383AC0D0